MLRKVFTTLQTAMKSRSPRSNTGSFSLQFVMYVNGTRNLLRTLPVAKSPHCVSRRRTPFSSGLSSRGPHRRTGTFNSFASLAHSNSVPKLQCGRKSPSIFSFLNFSAILNAASPRHKERPSLNLTSCDVYKIDS